MKVSQKYLSERPSGLLQARNRRNNTRSHQVYMEPRTLYTYEVFIVKNTNTQKHKKPGIVIM